MKQLEDSVLIEAIQGKGRRVRSAGGKLSQTIGLAASGAVLDGGNGLQFFVGCHTAIQEAGANLATFSVSQSPEGALSLGPIDAARLNGLIVIAQHLTPENLKELSRFLPLVVLGHDAASLDIPSFFIDYGAHAAIATRHLLERGHRSILLTYGLKNYYYLTGASIRRGYQWMLESYGIKPREEWIIPASLIPESAEGPRLLYQKLREMKERPTAIVSYSAQLPAAFAAIDQESGGSLLKELEIVCLNPVEGLAIPGVATFSCPFGEVAARAVHALMAIIRGEGKPTPLANGFTGTLLSGT